ncbi:ATP-dependent RNA helicase [Striga asiatica]|uniref:ATP-dependent RNA helicase n=1 Tax=Striga asiatica TaxID=4170 RepID=A0A5A7P8T9_STRAF|nr:ATP-dependent RNA helicase [Striga asiatica]
MGRSDDSISRRRSKKIKRKQENKVDPSSKVSARVAAIIAAKKRRHTGKRRMCQGMCFSLPTPEDPFNDKQGKTDPPRKRKRSSKENKKLEDEIPRLNKESLDKLGFGNTENGKSSLVSSTAIMGPEIAINVGQPTCKIISWDKTKNSWKAVDSVRDTKSPSKFLIMCLNTIQNALEKDERDQPLFANAWGIEFWNCYCAGKDVLETNGAGSNLEQIAWLASTAADSISVKEKEGASFSGPFLLYLVPSQEKAAEVRQICKLLKAHGIHTVSLHSGAALDHQINGLKSCEPEFVVSTPERLLELLKLRAIDISGVSLLVIDGPEGTFKGAFFDAIKSTRQFISENLQTVCFL